MNLRPARASDVERIARLHAESWRVAYRGMYRDEYLDGDVFEDRLKLWRQRLAAPAPNQHTIVADGGDALAGFACAFGDDDPRWGTLLDNLHVRPDGKRLGVGTRLIAEVARWSLREYPACGLYLWVLEPNAPARRFYERWGARNEESQAAHPPGGGIPGTGTLMGMRYVWEDPKPLSSADGEGSSID